MKNTLNKILITTTTLISTGAFAANIENPLYMPKSGNFYSKTGGAVMYKHADNTEALQKKGTNGKDEFPVWRLTEDFGYGITDRLAIDGRFGYTIDGDIDRKGMHRGRVGLLLRALTEEQPFVLDFYADAYLSGLSPMKGKFKFSNQTFTFDNYSNGRWGVIAGTRFGKTWDDFTLAAHAEYLQTFGNHNNKIDTSSVPGFPDEISVDLKGTNEITAGIDAMFQASKTISWGFGFEYVEHADNSVKSIHSQLSNNPTAQYIANQLLQQTKNMEDGWDEYILKVNFADQVTDYLQIAVFAEYTLDDSHKQSQNGTDVKTEVGIRANVQF